jgi:hypothetical protein
MMLFKRCLLIQDSRFKIQDARYRMQDPRFKIQDAKLRGARSKLCPVLHGDARCKVQDAGSKIQIERSEGPAKREFKIQRIKIPKNPRNPTKSAVLSA